MKYAISEKEAIDAKHPHEVFLINLVFNHIFLFVATLSASSLQMLVVLVPIISFGILAYTLWRAKRALVRDTWFVKCHWQVAAKRSHTFIIMLLIMAVAMLVILAVSGGHLRPQHYAIGGTAILPTMVTVLALVIMESDAMHQARNGMLPKWVVERYPNPDAALAEAEA